MRAGQRLPARVQTDQTLPAIQTRTSRRDLSFNPAKFRLPAMGTFGNAFRNIVRGDGFHSVDLSLFKNFAITERWRLQFRAEAVNSFNHVNYQGPVVNLNSTPGSIHRYRSAADRSVGLKLSF